VSLWKLLENLNLKFKGLKRKFTNFYGCCKTLGLKSNLIKIERFTCTITKFGGFMELKNYFCIEKDWPKKNLQKDHGLGCKIVFRRRFSIYYSIQKLVEPVHHGLGLPSALFMLNIRGCWGHWI
jgi:hypothetical protein